MKKLSLFMLMAVGLLISGSMSAMPERPVPPEPKAPEGIQEMTVPEHPALPERGLVKKTFNKVVRQTPNKAPMGGGDVAKIDETGYATLQAAFDAARNANKATTITMIDDATESDELYIYGNSDVILNLNGKTITLDRGNSINISSNGTDSYESTLLDKLEINGEGTIECLNGGWTILNYGTLSINDAIISSETDVAVHNDGEASIVSSSFSGVGKDYGVLRNYGTMTISGTTSVTASDETGTALENEGGTMTINGGTFNGYCGVYIYGYGDYCTVNQYGGEVNGDIMVSYRGYYKLYDGTIESISTEYWWANVYIEGGTVKGNINLKDESYSGAYNPLIIKGNPIIHGTIDAQDVSISGGIYDQQPNVAYMAAGYYLTKVGAQYGVIKAKVVLGDFGYLTIADALADAQDGDAIGLVDDHNETITITKNITINTNGKKLSGSITAGGSAVVSLLGKGYVSASLSTNGGNFSISEGHYYYSTDPTPYKANGCIVEKEGDWFVVKHVVAKIDETEYYSLEEALEAAELDATIKLVSDIDNNVNIDKSVKLDLDGHTISSYFTEHVVDITNNATVTLLNGNIRTYNSTNGFPHSYGIYVNENCTLTVDDVDISSISNDKSDSKNYGPYYGIYSKNATISVKGNTHILASYDGGRSEKGTITIADNSHMEGRDAGWYMNNSTITIQDNATLVGSNFGLYVYAGTTTINNGTLKGTNSVCGYGNSVDIFGGLFISGDVAIATYGGLHTLKGGTYTSKLIYYNGADKTTDYVNPEKYGYAYRFDGLNEEIGKETYTVKPVIAQIAGDTTYYFSLQEAVDVAPKDAEIILFKNTEKTQAWTDLNENVVINKSVTINLNDKNITGNLTAKGANVVVSIRENGNVNGALNVEDDGGTYKLYGGTYPTEPNSNFVPTTEGCRFKSTNPWVVEQVVAKINDTEYTSFNAAISAVKADETILLTQNTIFTSVTIGKNITIDLGDKVLSAKGDQTLTCSATITIKNGTIQNSIASFAYPDQLITNTKELTLEDVVIDNKKKDKYAVANAAGGTLTLKSDVTLSGQKAGVYVSGTSTINNDAVETSVMLGISGVTINNDKDASIILSSNEDNAAAVNINGGSCTFVGGYFIGNEENIIKLENDVNVAVEGGVYSPSNFTLLQNSIISGKKENKTKYKGQIAYEIVNEDCQFSCKDEEDCQYKTIKDAIDYMSSNSSISLTILRDITLDSLTNDDIISISNGKSVTLDLKGKIIVLTNCKIDRLFSVSGSTLIINDSEGNGKIDMQDKSQQMISASSSTIEINGGSLLSKSAEAILLSSSQITMNGGYLYSTGGNGIRCFVGTCTINMNGGKIEAGVPIKFQLGSEDDDSQQTLIMDGGELKTSSGGQAIFCWTNGASYSNIHISISGGKITGKVYLEAYTLAGVEIDFAEDVNITGGTFTSHYAIFNGEKGRGAITNLHYIEGGAYYFDYGNNSTSKTFSEFCEYIKPGHYAVKMCQNNAGTDGEEGTDWIMYQGNKYYFGPCDEDGKVFWAVIDAKGSKDPETINASTTLNPQNVDEYTDLNVTNPGGGETVEVTIPVTDDTIKVYRVDVEEGAGIVIPADAKLNVGYGGIVVNGNSTGTTYIKVMPKGLLEANGTVVSSDVKEIIIYSNQTDGSGSVLIDPDVTYNQMPNATVWMETKAHYDATNGVRTWQHFGIPVIGNEDLNNPTAPAIFADRATTTYFNQWNSSSWGPISYTDMKTPFAGYNLSNDDPDGGVNYIFQGHLAGNKNAPIKFDHVGWHVMANSYTAPIDVATLFKQTQEQFGDDLQQTIYIYDSESDSHKSANPFLVEMGDADFDNIAPMQGFIMKLDKGDGSVSGEINYRDAVWNNPTKVGTPLMAPKAMNVTKAHVVISSQNHRDVVKLYENGDYTNEFENGADASKYMESSLNIYASTPAGELSNVVTNNLEGTYLSMATDENEVYTMSFEKVNNINYLVRDMMTGNDIIIAEGNTYEFTAPANAKMENRFQIVNAANVPTNMKEMKANKTSGVYSLMGQYLGDVEQLGNLRQGVYIVNGVKIVK